MAKGTEPATGGASVTPSDSAQITKAHRAVYVGGAGNLTVTLADGDDVTFVGVAAGTVLPVICSIIKSTGTTATNIVVIG